MCAIRILKHTANRHGRALIITIVGFLLAVGPMQSGVAAQTQTELQPDSEQAVPDRGPVRLARPTWDTGWFQAEVVAELLRELGSVVDGPVTMENQDFYSGVADGEVDLWVNGWFPLHDAFVDRTSAVPIGFEVRGGALQGYLADRATVEALGITSLADLADPTVAAAFDNSGDGRADLVGCNTDWTCGPIVDHHLEAYGLTDTVEHLRGDYGPLMRATVERYRSGEPVLFYTFTPNWTVGELVPGIDVVWIPAPFPSLPAAIADQEPLTIIPGVAGCLGDPCSMGFAPNDIRSVANADFLAANPAVEALLERFEIPLTDILDQNARMIRGEDSATDIDAHAAQWIEDNRAAVDSWLAAAIDANREAGLPPLPMSVDSDQAADRVGPLRVVTRVAPPFVSYDDGRYQGFSIELLQIVAGDIGAVVDLYAVDTSAKLIDDVSRQAADLGVGALAITARREQSVDFTQPYFDSGLQILVADRNDGFFGGRLGAVARAFFSPDLLLLVLVLVGVLIIAAHIIWLTERGSNPDFPESYRAGIWESLWWAAVTATTVGYGDKTPKGPAGRVFGLFWMFSGLFVLAYFTAGIATAFTIDELNRSIDEPAELRGHTVGAVADSAATDFLERQGIAATGYLDEDDAYRALLTGEVEAVVHDAAILQHFVATNEQGGAAVSGLVFAERGFGFALSPDSELAERVNRALLELIESGEFDELHETWFGVPPSGGN
ncbi:MAG: glycine betaine/L-proline ABC transporter substrate-binding protein ProX [Acidimicrobiales bacterium]